MQALKIEDKIWGRKETLYTDNHIQVDRLEVKKGGYCSLHRHQHKINKFYVECGLIKIIVKKNPNEVNDLNNVQEYILNPGEVFIIYPYRWHQFEAVENSVCYEMTYVYLKEDDINRFSEGGVYDGKIHDSKVL